MSSVNQFYAGPLFSCSGWVAVVTGGGTGIGLMAAQALAANGAKVYITGRRQAVLEAAIKTHGTPEALGEHGGQIVPLVMDVTDKESIQKAVKVVEGQDGFLSVLINNAGMEGGRPTHGPDAGMEAYGKALFAEDPQKDWLTPYMCMTVGPYLCSAAFVHLLAAAGTKGPVKRPGNIINISSLSGLTKWSQNGQFAYNCAKAAVIQLSKLMATDLCAEEIGIRVNNLAPGYFSTELTTGTASTNGKSSWPIDEFKAEMKRVHSNADRPGTDTEMGSGILLLATNDYVNGHTLLIDGGLLLRHP
ncbi:hypothetical protein EHS25_002230 [Saitozyma podzolica]|uniref:Ketoreductase domain-containing protein n=1 Tax=Saitozyma podzolica TaxID=1890683 RepID=A0A427YES7_9TREE|nr:hypothetical protein EHS25_002230 [Saitozyma podzolica]